MRRARGRHALSIEWGPGRDSGYSAAQWAKIALDGTREFMAGYYAARGSNTNASERTT